MFEQIQPIYSVNKRTSFKLLEVLVAYICWEEEA